MGISDWAEEHKPREKLMQRGAGSLSDTELLAIMLRTGVPGKSALDLGRELLERFNGLTGLLEAPHAALRAVSGVGVAKATQLVAIMELVRRALREEMRRGVNLSSPAAVRSFLKLSLATRDREVFVVIFLDAQNGVLAVEEVFAGTLDQTNVYPREIVRRALQHNAAAVIFAHNHPSGVAEPSRADEVLTQALKQALALVDVKVLDHFVIGGHADLSFAERGLL
jgi:DNA repair protein RadC